MESAEPCLSLWVGLVGYLASEDYDKPRTISPIRLGLENWVQFMIDIALGRQLSPEGSW